MFIQTLTQPLSPNAQILLGRAMETKYIQAVTIF